MFDGKTWTTFSDENLGLPFVTEITFDRQGTAWFGTRSGGLTSFDGVKWTVHAGDRSHWGIFGGGIKNITFDGQGRVWTLGTEGLRVYDRKTWVTITPENSGIEGWPKAIAADHQGRIWIVTDKAVNVAPLGWSPR